MLLSTVSFANTTTQSDTTKLSPREIYTDAKEAIKQLGSALKVGAEHVYTVLVRQQVVHSITNCLIYIFLFITIRFMVVRFYRYARVEYEGSFPDPGVFFGTFFLTCITLWASIYFITSVEVTITGFVNPEYGALKSIVDMINKH